MAHVNVMFLEILQDFEKMQYGPTTTIEMGALKLVYHHYQSCDLNLRECYIPTTWCTPNTTMECTSRYHAWAGVVPNSCHYTYPQCEVSLTNMHRVVVCKGTMLPNPQLL